MRSARGSGPRSIINPGTYVLGKDTLFFFRSMCATYSWHYLGRTMTSVWLQGMSRHHRSLIGELDVNTDFNRPGTYDLYCHGCPELPHRKTMKVPSVFSCNGYVSGTRLTQRLARATSNSCTTRAKVLADNDQHHFAANIVPSPVASPQTWR